MQTRKEEKKVRQELEAEEILVSSWIWRSCKPVMWTRAQNEDEEKEDQQQQQK